MPFILHINHEGLTCPSFQCDCCGKLITDAAQALLVWDNHDEKSWTPRVICKGYRHCDNESDRYRLSMELDTALIYLLTNSGMTKAALHRAMQKAEALGAL